MKHLERAPDFPVGEKIEDQTAEQQADKKQQENSADHSELHIPLNGKVQQLAFELSFFSHGSTLNPQKSLGLFRSTSTAQSNIVLGEVFLNL
ncbi:MAG: hypothetical protein R6V08_09405 [Desulfuromonadales bacterium]